MGTPVIEVAEQKILGATNLLLFIPLVARFDPSSPKNLARYVPVSPDLTCAALETREQRRAILGEEAN
ncbi:hypothetical protein EON77_04000 [bacterium]|nr:MAG: hypothetical protein EON77_04000 [bacterium]